MNSSQPADQAEGPRFPQRDEEGRIVLLPEFVIFAVLSVAVAAAMLAAVDAVLSLLLGFGEFGQISGFISGILAVFVFFEDFRAWRERPSRWIAMPAAALLGLAAGMGVLAGLPDAWPPLFVGILAAALAAMVYTVIWFVGVRLTREGH